MISNQRDKEDKTFDSAVTDFCKNLNRFEATTLSYLRLWYNGIDGRKKLERDLTVNLGYVGGYKATRAFGELCDVIIRKTRRRLVFQPIDSAKYTEDESWFIKLIANSINGLSNDELFMKSLFLPQDVGPSVVVLANEIGIAIKSVLIKAD
tara:strand:+ start:108 stop:560 length:453 start_codon:yes stop_codon:yes gene_type:complete